MRKISEELLDGRFDIKWYDCVDSTSAVIEREHDKMADATVIAAEFQTAGRGQGDHKWHSVEGENLTFSILMKYGSERVMRPIEQQIITPATSLAVVDFLADFGIEAGIKKPNDIYVDGKKICGMLIENGIRCSMMERTILGIGININQTSFPSDLPNPVSIAQLTGKHYDKKICLRAFLRHFAKRFDAIWTDPDSLWKEYESKIVSIVK